MRKKFKQLFSACLFLLIVVTVLTGVKIPLAQATSNSQVLTYGDVNGDGLINSTDLTLVRRYLLEIISEFPSSDGFKAADVNGDGLINSIDYVILRKYLLEIIDIFPVEEAYPIVPVVDSEPPTIPQNVSVAAKTHNTVTLTWFSSIDSVGIAGYKVYYILSSQIDPSIDTETKNCLEFFIDSKQPFIEYKIEDLLPNTTYVFTVSSFDAAGNESEESDSFEVATYPEVLSPKEYTLFALDSTTFLGSNTTVNGDIFVRNTLQNLVSNLIVNGTIYCQSTSVGSFAPQNKYITKLSTNPSDINYYGKYDSFFNTNDPYKLSILEYLYYKLISNAKSNCPETFPSYYSRDTRELYLLYGSNKNDPFNSIYVDSNHGRFRKLNPLDISSPINGSYIELSINATKEDDLILRYDPNVLNSSPLDFGLGNFIMEGTDFVIKSDMFFDGNLTISTAKITKDILNKTHSGVILATGDIILQGHNTFIDCNLQLISLNGSILIESGNNDFKGFALAPNGEIKIKGDSNTYTGSFIGRNISVTANSTFYGSDNFNVFIADYY